MVSNWPPTMWNALGRLGPESSTQNRTRSPTRAWNVARSYWLAMPLNTTRSGFSATTLSESTSLAASGLVAALARNTSDWTST